MQITGYWYPANSSARHDAKLHIKDGHYTLKIVDNDELQGMVANVSVSDRVGNIPRKMTLENHSIFETLDNNSVDNLLHKLRHKDGSSHFIHILETRWQSITIAITLTITIVFSSVYWGLPWASEKLAYAIPVGMSEQISAGTFDVLNKYILDPSELPEARQQAIRKHFKKTLLTVQSEKFNYRLYFRQLGDMPNAFALPSGQIIVTDKLIEMADNQQEIDSVLLHEIGHVVHRHGLQQIIHNSFITIALTIMTGDATAVEEMMIALPVFLLESQYSRASESEADEYAFKHMIKLGIDPIYFAHMFEKMLSLEKDENLNSNEQPDEYSEFLSTHPASPRRIQRAKEYSAKYFHNNSIQN